MELFDKVAELILSINKKMFHYYMAGVLGCISLISCGMVYFIYRSRAEKYEQLSSLYEQANKNNKIMHDHEKISKEEQRIQTLLEDNKGFSIKGYFEQFCAEHNVTADPGWDTESRSIEGNEAFDEVVLAATFKGQTTQTLVTLLNSLDANEIVYIKELDIKTEENKTISFNLTIATKKHKRFWSD